MRVIKIIFWQGDADNYSDLNGSLRNRFEATARAYELSEDPVSCDKVVKLCWELGAQKKKGRMYKVYRPKVLGGLEMGTLVGDPRLWLDNTQTDSRQNRGGLRKMKTKSNFFTNPDIQAGYRQRLEEVIEILDVDALHLLEDTDHEFDDSGFSSTFYKQFLYECCGVNLDDGWSKVLRRKHSKHFNFLDLSYDPINIVRTFQIFKDIFDLDLDIDLYLVKLIGRISAIDILVALNMMFALTDENLRFDERKDKVISLVRNFDQKIVDNLVVWDLSLPQCFNILQEIGFTRAEVDKLWFDCDDLYILSEVCNKFNEFEDHEMFMDTMQKRKVLIDQDGMRLGIADIGDTFYFLMNWDKVVHAMDAANVEGHPCYVNFRNTSRDRIKIESLPYRSISCSAGRSFLFKYFDYKQHVDKEKIKEFDRIFRRIPHAKDVPLKIIVESIYFLESLNFSKEQIELGYPVVFYEKDILRKKIYEATASMGMGERWMDKHNALCVLNYLIEVESNFSFTSIYTGILNNMEKGLSLKEFQALINDNNDNNDKALVNDDESISTSTES